MRTARTAPLYTELESCFRDDLLVFIHYSPFANSHEVNEFQTVAEVHLQLCFQVIALKLLQ